MFSIKSGSQEFRWENDAKLARGVHFAVFLENIVLLKTENDF